MEGDKSRIVKICKRRKVGFSVHHKDNYNPEEITGITFYPDSKDIFYNPVSRVETSAKYIENSYSSESKFWEHCRTELLKLKIRTKTKTKRY